MKFDRRNIDKEVILRYLKDNNITWLVRQIKIDELIKSEIVVMDKWASNFYRDLNPKEREIRLELQRKYMFDSFPRFVEDDDYKNLTSLSEALLSLFNDQAGWIDVHMVVENLQLRDKICPEDAGRYPILKQICINAIIDHFDK